MIRCELQMYLLTFDVLFVGIFILNTVEHWYDILKYHYGTYVTFIDRVMEVYLQLGAIQFFFDKES